MGVVNTTYTFNSTDVITSGKMNNIIDETFFTSDAVDGTTLEVPAGINKLRVRTGGITSNELAANSVTTNSISNLNVTTDKLANLSVTSAKLADNSVTESKIPDTSVVASKLNSGQTGTAPIIAARATLQTRLSQTSTSAYTSIAVTMAITSSGSPRTVTVTSATNHGYLAGEPFFIFMQYSGSLNWAYLCGFVENVLSPNQFTCLTTSTTLPNSSGNIYFLNSTICKSINIKRASPGRAILQSAITNTGTGSGFSGFVSINDDFNATFTTPLLNDNNLVVVNVDNVSSGLNYFNFEFPTSDYINFCVFA